ncbi:hypothetical protein AB9M41_004271 [Vibrio alginolyticus]
MSKRKFLALLAALASTALTGCAVKNDRTELQGLGLTYQSEVKKAEDGTLSVEVEAAPAAGRENGAINSALRNASNYCLQMDKGVKVTNIDSDAHLLVNGVAKLDFECR